MNRRDDDRPMLEEQLRSALRSRADEVEPADDAYARLAVRVAGEAGTRRPGWWRQPQWLAVPAAVCLAVVVAVAVVLPGRDQPAQRIDTAAPASAPSTLGDDQPRDGADPVAFPGTDPAAWFPTPAAAGEAFARTILGEPDLDLAPVEQGRIPVRARGEGGTPGPVVGHLQVVERSGDGDRPRYGIAGAGVDTITIDTPAPGAPVPKPVAVTGRSTSFEGALQVTVRAMDGTIVGEGLAQGGAGPDLEPFDASIDTDARGPAFVVVSALPMAEGASGRHAAVAVELGSPQAASGTYAVVRVRTDDPDGGLVVRSQPRADAHRLGVLAPATTGVTALGPTEGRWWQIAAGDLQGWVNSSYLARQVDLDATRSAELRQLTDDTARALQQHDGAALAALPWDGDHPVLVGWAGDPHQVTAATLKDPSYWTTRRTFRLPDGFAPPAVEATFFDYAWPEGWRHDGTGSDDCCVYGVSDRTEVRRLHHGSIRASSPTGSDWTVTRLHVDWTSGRPRIAALLVERWEP